MSHSSALSLIRGGQHRLRAGARLLAAHLYAFVSKAHMNVRVFFVRR